jgi:hypothetical protein
LFVILSISFYLSISSLSLFLSLFLSFFSTFSLFLSLSFSIFFTLSFLLSHSFFLFMFQTCVSLYYSRAQLKPLLYEGFMAGGVAAGGQLTTTTEIENFPGFPEAISGWELMERMKQQSIRWGTRVLSQVK